MTMGSDYSAAIAGLVALIVVFTAMAGFMLTRPSDLPQSTRQ
ncbi:MAG: hypothetical protein VKN13_02865 [Cyanobacteriota bacterium]|nr:hypothetical protein [Cyanobacteriota bacterium]